MDVFTIQMSRHRLARQHQIVLLDTTVKTGSSPFAPTWDMVMQHKADTLSNAEYTAQYRQRMMKSWVERRGEWMEILHSPDRLALACFCRPDAFCHRHLLRGIFKELCPRFNIPFHYYGELQ